MEFSGENDLSRKLGFRSLTSIVVANMIGAGIFTTSGLLMGELRNPWLLLILWGIGGIVACCGALSYGELGAAMPEAGGEYTFLSRLFHPVHGFLSGWVSFIVGFSAPIAASALGCAEYFFRAFPWVTDAMNLPELVLKKAVAILVILIFSGIHMLGVETSAKVQNLLTLLKVTLIAGLVLFGFFLGAGDFSHLSQGTDLPSGFAGIKTMALSLMWVMFAYSGWNAATYVGSEVKDPRRNLPRALIWGTIIVMALYLLLNLLFLYALPPADMEGVIAIGGLATDRLFNATTDTLISMLIGFALFSSLSAFIIIGPRVYYAMAKDGYFFRFLAEVHPVFKVPVKAIGIQALLGILMVMTGSFDQILTYMGFALGIFPILAVIGVFKLRRSGRSVLTLPGYPWVQLVFIGVSMLILTLAFFERPIESCIALGTVAVGLPFYFIFKNIYGKRNRG